MEPALSSVAAHAIPAGTTRCGTTVRSDQRGVARAQGVRCDMGSVQTAFLHGPTAVASDGLHVWVANALNNSVGEFLAATGAPVKWIQNTGACAGCNFSGPAAIATAGGDVWVANASNNSITEFNAATGALVKWIDNACAWRLASSMIR